MTDMWLEEMARGSGGGMGESEGWLLTLTKLLSLEVQFYPEMLGNQQLSRSCTLCHRQNPSSDDNIYGHCSCF